MKYFLRCDILISEIPELKTGPKNHYSDSKIACRLSKHVFDILGLLKPHLVFVKKAFNGDEVYKQRISAVVLALVQTQDAKNHFTILLTYFEVDTSFVL